MVVHEEGEVVMSLTAERAREMSPEQARQWLDGFRATVTSRISKALTKCPGVVPEYQKVLTGIDLMDADEVPLVEAALRAADRKCPGISTGIPMWGIALGAAAVLFLFLWRK